MVEIILNFLVFLKIGDCTMIFLLNSVGIYFDRIIREIRVIEIKCLKFVRFLFSKNYFLKLNGLKKNSFMEFYDVNLL